LKDDVIVVVTHRANTDVDVDDDEWTTRAMRWAETRDEDDDDEDDAAEDDEDEDAGGVGIVYAPRVGRVDVGRVERSGETRESLCELARDGVDVARENANVYSGSDGAVVRGVGAEDRRG
jgi:hypothetical protein